jgi:hypothetical protein
VSLLRFVIEGKAYCDVFAVWSFLRDIIAAELPNSSLPCLHQCRISPFYEFSETTELEQIMEYLSVLLPWNQSMVFTRFKKILARCSHDFALSTFSYKNISIWRPCFLLLILYTISKTLFLNKKLQRWSKWSLARLLFSKPTLKPIVLEKYPGNLIWLSPSRYSSTGI